MLAVVVGIAVALVPTTTLASWLRVDPDGSWIARHQVELVTSLVVVCGFGGAIAGGAVLARRRVVRRSFEVPVTGALGRYDRALDIAVQEAIAAAVNDLLGPQGIVAFPTHAPRLVELDTSQIATSGTTRYVREFVVEHESSAIGLAGPRWGGAPTATLLRRGQPRADGVARAHHRARRGDGEIGAQPPVREAALAVALRDFDPAVLEANR